MKLYTKISEKLVALEKKLIKTYDIRFSLFESKMRKMMVSQAGSAYSEQKVSQIIYISGLDQLHSDIFLHLNKMLDHALCLS